MVLVPLGHLVQVQPLLLEQLPQRPLQVVSRSPASKARHLLRNQARPSLRTPPQQPSWVQGGRPHQRLLNPSWAPQLGSMRLCEALALPQAALLLQQLAQTQLFSQALVLGKQVKAEPLLHLAQLLLSTLCPEPQANP